MAVMVTKPPFITQVPVTGVNGVRKRLKSRPFKLRLTNDVALMDVVLIQWGINMNKSHQSSRHACGRDR